jgi:hypothetical protein
MRLALRMRVNMSESGSVIMVVISFLTSWLS